MGKLETLDGAGAVGYTHAVHAIGTVESGTVTPLAANGHLQSLTNNGAFTLAPPVTNTTLVIHVTNGAAAGAITTSGWTLVDGDDLTVTDEDQFLLYAATSGDVSHLSVRALQ